jgi:hypothetical protein
MRFVEEYLRDEYRVKPLGTITTKPYEADCGEYTGEVKELINYCKPGGDKIVTEFPTKSGVHIITLPFDRQQFIELCEIYYVRDADIKKNHLTLLYENL